MRINTRRFPFTNEGFRAHTKMYRDNLLHAYFGRYNELSGWEPLDDRKSADIYETTRGKIAEYEIVAILLAPSQPSISRIEHVAKLTVSGESGIDRVGYNYIASSEVCPSAIKRRLNKQFGVKLKKPLTRRERFQ